MLFFWAILAGMGRINTSILSVSLMMYIVHIGTSFSSSLYPTWTITSIHINFCEQWIFPSNSKCVQGTLSSYKTAVPWVLKHIVNRGHISINLQRLRGCDEKDGNKQQGGSSSDCFSCLWLSFVEQGRGVRFGDLTATSWEGSPERLWMPYPWRCSRPG